MPVVATDSGGSREFIDESNGLIVPPDNAEALREGLEKVMRNLSSYERHSISANVRNKFSTDKFLRKIDDVYSAVTAHPNYVE